VDEWLAEHLVCPVDHQTVERSADFLVCASGHAYPCIDEVPVMLAPDVGGEHDAWRSKFEQTGATSRPTGDSIGVDPFVQENIAATNGVMYRALVGKLARYPIPHCPMPPGRGRRLLDVGCNWGRWCVTAARHGYVPIGIDASLDAVRAAQRVARQLDVSAAYLVADARRLPFASGSFDAVFSYSVLQHLEKADAKTSLIEIARVLKPYGEALIQLPNIFGVRSLQNRLRRLFRPRTPFDVNYYTPRELETLFRAVIGPTAVTVDGYFSLNSQTSDLDLLPVSYRTVVKASSALQALSEKLPWLGYFADSLYVRSVRDVRTSPAVTATIS
jgi:2-polyprenyl-3-methyl-5-hydroxy-6-metoxy-1,4-benzoquinol methylase/uncharacterized protein YbaR (Trm112 family)